MTQQLTVIFKPTSRCNLRCKYCYAARERECFDSVVSQNEAKRAFDWVRRYCEELNVKDLTVIWHGGEPLIMGKDYIERCIDYYTSIHDSIGVRVRNQVQTNLTLATDEFVPLLKRSFDSRVGFSLDYNSNTRLFANGTDATPVILDNAMRLKDEGVNLGAISMLTARNVGCVKEIYDWFKGMGIPFRLNRMFPTSLNETNIADSVSAEQYANAVCELFDIWLDDPEPAFVETVQGAVQAYLRDISKLCSVAGQCSESFLCITGNGTLLPCGRFDTDTYAIGNYKTDSVGDVLSKKRAIAHLGEKRDCSNKCAECKWRSLCVAGCLHSRLFGWQDDECVTNKIIWQHLDEALPTMGLERGFLKNLSRDDAEELAKKLNMQGPDEAVVGYMALSR